MPPLPRDESIIRALLYHVGEDPTRQGLLDTPTRVLKAWEYWCGGYHMDPESVMRTFEDGAEGYDQVVLVKNIPIYSHCEHHLAPFFGVAHIGYLPDKRIIGLSKLARLAEIFSRRLQVQERLTTQIAGAIQEHLKPLGIGVVVECRHMCMESRGVRTPGTITTTSALLGVFRSNANARSEFLRLIGK